MWELHYKESWALKNWCVWTVVLEKTLEGPLDGKEIQPAHPKGNQSWIFIGRTDAEAETLILWPPDAKSWLIAKHPDAGKDWRWEETGTTEDEMVGWHHWHDRQVWASSGSWWWTGKPGMLQSMRSQRVGHEWLNWTSGLMVKNPPAMWETWLGSLGWEDPLEKGMATYFSILAWRTAWTEESGGLQSRGSQRNEHGWATDTFTSHTVYEDKHSYHRKTSGWKDCLSFNSSIKASVSQPARGFIHMDGKEAKDPVDAFLLTMNSFHSRLSQTFKWSLWKWMQSISKNNLLQKSEAKVKKISACL